MSTAGTAVPTDEYMRGAQAAISAAVPAREEPAIRTGYWTMGGPACFHHRVEAPLVDGCIRAHAAGGHLYRCDLSGPLLRPEEMRRLKDLGFDSRIFAFSCDTELQVDLVSRRLDGTWTPPPEEGGGQKRITEYFGKESEI